jgi:hypothetical protein
MVTGGDDARQDVLQFPIIVEQPQQRFAPRAVLTDTEYVLRGRIQADDEQIVVEQDDAGAQAVDDGLSLDGFGAAIIR